MAADDSAMQLYLERCKATAAGYIERATRFNVTDLVLLGARPVMRQFSVTVRHDLEVISEAIDYHGVHHPDKGDFGTADWKWYQEEVGAQARSEFVRPETMDSLVQSVRNQAYAAISARTCIRTHPRRLFHTYTCNGCHGRGRVQCGNCSGAGEVRCGSCSGSGRTSCSSCGGSGSTTRHVTVTDYNGHTRHETQHRSCGSCSGGRVTCFTCGGSGKNRCGNCAGTGELTCTGCSGHGYLTKVTSTATYTNPGFAGRYPEGTPDYVHAALCKVGFASLASHGDIALQKVDVLRDKSAAEFVYQCAIPFCELSIDVRGVTSQWVMFGADPQIFDAGGVLEALLESDFKALADVSSGGARWSPWFYRSARKAVAPFMESEVNQMVIDATSEGLAPNAIVEVVNRSVSETYVEQTLKNLRTTVSVAANWSRLRSLIVLIVLSIPFSFAANGYLQRNKAIDLLSADKQRFIYQPDNAAIQWEMGLMTVPFILLGWFVAKWLSVRWLKKAGGERTVLWAQRQGLLMGKWTALLIVVTAVGTTGAFFKRWPMWVDDNGKGYGLIPLYEPRIPYEAQEAAKDMEKMRREGRKFESVVEIEKKRRARLKLEQDNNAAAGKP
ncbi:hypothetical protein INH39_18025 [Massilia violaceinigra]|uniref:CR-type domain-containing protein n=1 Tax=Massilia violaceinigra TaxID=2045208 RepID=A0ABY3ZZZ2_9BURK|nr:hypothetical protein [Massilia violaceinigra]UOD27429.1 hypothetical protein INH39_18025 [Massilia violaceinigra]